MVIPCQNADNNILMIGLGTSVTHADIAFAQVVLVAIPVPVMATIMVVTNVVNARWAI